MASNACLSQPHLTTLLDVKGYLPDLFSESGRQHLTATMDTRPELCEHTGQIVG